VAELVDETCRSQAISDRVIDCDDNWGRGSVVGFESFSGEEVVE